MVRFTRAGVALTVGIILLTGLIIGGLFWAKEQGEQARRDEAIQIAEDNLIDEAADEGVALNEGDVTESEDTTSESTSEEEATGSESTNGTTNESASESTPTDDTATEQLPATGVGDALPFVGAGLLAFSIVAYSRSLRGLSDLL